MKALTLVCVLLLSASVYAQKQDEAIKGKVYGAKPTTAVTIRASKLEAFMGKKVRISTTIRATVLKVTKEQGGWFEIDAGGGKIIAAHFTKYDITIPKSLAGHTVIVEGIAQKQIAADDLQHLAGDTVTGKKEHTTKVNPKQKVTFEVKGLMVEK